MLVMHFASTLIFLFAIVSTGFSLPMHTDSESVHTSDDTSSEPDDEPGHRTIGVNYRWYDADDCAALLHEKYTHLAEDLKAVVPSHKDVAQFAESMSKGTGWPEKLEQLGNKECLKNSPLDTLYFLLDPKVLGVNKRTWRNDFEDAKACVRSLQSDEDVIVEGPFQSYHQSVILKDSKGPMRLERMLTFFTTQPSFSEKCFGFPINLLPFIYPDHPEKTLEEACAQSLLAQVRDNPGLPEQYEQYIIKSEQASEAKYEIIKGLETKVTKVLGAKQLEPTCSDARKILYHVLPEGRKDWLASSETPKHHTQLLILTKVGSPKVGTKRRVDVADLLDTQPNRRVRARTTSRSPTPGQPNTVAQSLQGLSKGK